MLFQKLYEAIHIGLHEGAVLQQHQQQTEGTQPQARSILRFSN